PASRHRSVSCLQPGEHSTASLSIGKNPQNATQQHCGHIVRPKVALLALVRFDGRLRRAFRGRLHPRRALTLWTLRRRAARPGLKRTSPALRLLLTDRLGGLLAAGAKAGFVCWLVVGPRRSECKSAKANQAKRSRYNAHRHPSFEPIA